MIIFLLGPTASGKTDLSLRLAEALDGEIVSVDSGLVYRGMDIGTAKPSLAERRGIAHHLIDIRHPADPYSAADFCTDAAAAIAAIQARGRVPILAGGTMLYFHALEHGLANLPEADPALRQTIADDAARFGWQHVHAELARVDPASARRIHVNDPQRLQRAVEVFRLTGVPLSTLQRDTRSALAESPVKLALVPTDRTWLHARIERRFAAMQQAGFLDEVRTLAAQPGMHASLPAMRSVGYRQALSYLSGESNAELWEERAIIATRQLAKRQLTWMRGMQELNSLACDGLNADELVASAQAQLAA